MQKISYSPYYLGRRLMYSAFLSMAALCLSVSSANAQAPSISSIYQNSWTKIAQAGTDAWMHFPRGISYEVPTGSVMERKVVTNWQTCSDTPQFPMTHGWSGSVDDAATFDSPAPTNTPEIDMMGCIRRNDNGVMIAIPFYLGYSGANPTPPFIFSYHTSTDNGTTWVKQTNGASATGFPAGQLLAGFRFHRGIIQDADGTLYAPAHAQWKTGGTFELMRTMLMKSTDHGVTWTYVSTIQYTPTIGYSETAIVRCKDGSILAVMRNESNSLKFRRSPPGDNGVNWGGGANYLPGIPTNAGVDPCLELMPNGILVLSYGNNVTGNMRHCLMAFSADGNGTNWTNVTQTYTSSTSGLGNKSTGYTSAFSLRNNRIMQLSDRGLYSYYGTNQHPTPNPFSVWSKTIDLVLDHRNRIDLKTKYVIDPSIVTTDMTYANATFPEARVSGAFDANTDYWNGAFKAATNGYYKIDLKQNHTLNGISICLLRGREQSATIQYSLDGINFTTFKTYTDVTHYTVDYTSLALTPITARYIKVNVTSADAMVGLNEINLFNAAETFEDYALNDTPYGYTASDVVNPDFWVSEGVTPLPTGYESQRALYMYDNDSANKELSKTGYTATAIKTLEFRLKIKAFAATNGAIQWRLISGTTNAFRLRVIPGGAVQYYNGSYVTIPGASILTDTWTHIKVVANASTGTGTISINGGTALAIGKETTVASMNGFLFASGGGAPVGDKALFDDILLY